MQHPNHYSRSAHQGFDRQPDKHLFFMTAVCHPKLVEGLLNRLNDAERLRDRNGKHGEGLCLALVPDLQWIARTKAEQRF